MKHFLQVTDKINWILSEEFELDIDCIKPLANFRQVLNLDSLDYVDLVALIENNFSIKVKPEDFSGIISFHDLYEYIIARVHYNEPGDSDMEGRFPSEK